MANGTGTIVEHRLDAEGADQLLLAGVGDSHIHELSRRFGIRVVLRGDHLVLSGALEGVERAVPVLHHLIELARLRAPFDLNDIGRFVEEADARGAITRVEHTEHTRIALPGSRKVITSKSEGQRRYLEALSENDVVVGIGPAGTGKTYLAVARAVDAAGLVAAGRPLVLTAGGSSFFDRVGERLGAAGFDRPVLRVLRSGCYLTHDTMGYARAFARIRAETRLRLPPGGLEPALEVWALVQSRPEPGRAILTMGKRDVGHDAGLPQPVRWFRPGMAAPAALPEGHVTVALNDQHAHMTLPEGSPLAFGDMVGFGIGHPCTTFERWQLIWMVNEQWEAETALRTFF